MTNKSKNAKKQQAQKAANNANLGVATNRLLVGVDKLTESMDRFEKMLINVGKTADATAEKTKKAFSTDAAERYLDIRREIASVEADIKDLENTQSDRYKEIVEAAGDNKKLLDDTVKIVKEQSNQQLKLLKAKLAELSMTEEMKKLEEARLKLEQKRYAQFSKNLRVVDDLVEKIKEIPVIGEVLGEFIDTDKIKQGLFNLFKGKKAKAGSGAAMAGGASDAAGMAAESGPAVGVTDAAAAGGAADAAAAAGGAGGAMEGLSSAMAGMSAAAAATAAAVAAVVALIVGAFYAAYKLNAQITEIANQSGVTYDRAEATSKILRAQHVPYDEIVKYTKQIADNFGVIGAHLTEDIGLSLHRFQFNLQLSEEDASSLLQSSYLLGSSLKSAVDSASDFDVAVVNGTKAALDQLGIQVDNKQLQNESRNALMDIAKINKTNLALYGKSTSTLAKSVTNMRSLGLEFDQVAKTAESVLDFESSIENEMKTNVLLGKSINLNMVRYESLFGNAEGVAREMNKVLTAQNINLETFNDMLPFQKRALSDTFGMQADEMQLMLLKNKLGAGYVEQLKKEGKLTEKALRASGQLTEDQAKQILYAENRASIEAQLKMGMADMMDNLKQATSLLVPILRSIVDWFNIDTRTDAEKLADKEKSEAIDKNVMKALQKASWTDKFWGRVTQKQLYDEEVKKYDANPEKYMEESATAERSLSRFSASGRTSESSSTTSSTKLLEENNRLMAELIKKVDQPVQFNVNGRVIDEIDSQVALRKSYNVTDQSYGTFAKK